MLAKITRSGLVAGVLGFGLGAGMASSGLGQEMQVAKNASCGCCTAWMERMQAEGFSVSFENLDYDVLYQLKLASGVPEEMMGCHTARVEGYVIEGHVPPADIRRLLAEAPEAVGLAVPGMPAGAPGMEYGGPADAYQVYLIAQDGSTGLYASYPGQ